MRTARGRFVLYCRGLPPSQAFGLYRSLPLLSTANQHRAFATVPPASGTSDSSVRQRRRGLDKEEAEARLAWLRRVDFVRPGPYSQLLSYAQRSGSDEFLEKAMSMLHKVRLGDSIGYASLLFALSTTNNLDEMFAVYARMKKENLLINATAATPLIRVSLRLNKPDRAFEVLQDMIYADALIDQGVVNCFLEYYLERRDVDRLVSVLQVASQYLEPDDRMAVLDWLWMKLCNPFSKRLHEACRLIEKMGEILPEEEGEEGGNATPANEGEKSESEGGDVPETKEERVQRTRDSSERAKMVEHWQEKINYLFVQMIQRRELVHAQRLLKVMLEQWKLQPNQRTLTTYIQACNVLRDSKMVDEIAELVTNGVLQSDAQTFTALVNCYARRRMKREALHYFGLMQQHGLKGDAVTYKVLLVLCVVTKDKELGMRLLAQAEEQGLATNADLTRVINSLRSMPDRNTTEQNSDQGAGQKEEGKEID